MSTVTGYSSVVIIIFIQLKRCPLLGHSKCLHYQFEGYRERYTLQNHFDESR